MNCNLSASPSRTRRRGGPNRLSRALALAPITPDKPGASSTVGAIKRVPADAPVGVWTGIGSADCGALDVAGAAPVPAVGRASGIALGPLAQPASNSAAQAPEMMRVLCMRLCVVVFRSMNKVSCRSRSDNGCKQIGKGNGEAQRNHPAQGKARKPADRRKILR